MVRRLLPICALGALFSVGCVEVTDPVGDIDKAEPNKELLGAWDCSNGHRWVIDRHDVKGNPKGLMRIRIFDQGGTIEKPDHTMWFFSTVVGKRTYTNLLMNDGGFADLSTEGAYAKWTKLGGQYWVGFITIKGDELTLDGGDTKAFNALMEKEKIGTVGNYYKTGPGWMAKYLEKPDAIFDGTNKMEFSRVKKK